MKLGWLVYDSFLYVRVYVSFVCSYLSVHLLLYIRVRQPFKYTYVIMVSATKQKIIFEAPIIFSCCGCIIVVIIIIIIFCNVPNFVGRTRLNQVLRTETNIFTRTLYTVYISFRIFFSWCLIRQNLVYEQRLHWQPCW